MITQIWRICFASKKSADTMKSHMNSPMYRIKAEKYIEQTQVTIIHLIRATGNQILSEII